MGAGKTTAARAADPGTRSIPTSCSSRELGEAIAAFFEREGEARLPAREEELVLDALSRADGGAVALGGGSLGSQRVCQALGEHTVVLLDVDADTAWERVAALR